MRVLAVAVLLGVSAVGMGQIELVPPPPPPPPPPLQKIAPVAVFPERPALQGATADTVTVPDTVLRGLAVSEPDISARDEAPQPGMVWLKVLVSKTGAVEEVVVVNGPGELPGVAMAAVKGWKYKPYLVNGEAKEIQSSILLWFENGVGKRTLDGGTGVAGMSGMGSNAPPPVVKRAPPSGAVQVSSGVVAGLMERPIVSPVYPPEAKAAHVQGVVVMHAIISKTGEIKDLQVISGHPLLTQAAMDAVRQWRYRPYLLQGVPVEVETTINVNFTFGAPAKPPVDAGGEASPGDAAEPK